MLYLLRLILVLIFMSTPAHAADEELGSIVQRVLEQATKDGAAMEIPVNKYHKAGEKAARESTRVFNSPEFQEKLRCEQQRLKEQVLSDYAPEPEKRDISIPGKLAENEKLYLFFSSSIPDETIHTYLAAMEGLEESDMTMVMKGFVPDERGRYLIRIAQKDQSCRDRMQQKNPVACERFKTPIKIQPSLFDRYMVTQVPAVVYEHEGQAWKITGDAELAYLVERINQEAKSPGLSSLVTALLGIEK